MAQKWKTDYNYHRPHEALNNRTPNDLLCQNSLLKL